MTFFLRVYGNWYSMFYIAYVICEFILLNEIHKQLCVTVSLSAESVFPHFELFWNILIFLSHYIKCEVHRGQHKWNVYTVIYPSLLKALFRTIFCIEKAIVSLGFVVTQKWFRIRERTLEEEFNVQQEQPENLKYLYFWRVLYFTRYVPKPM
jgi:hypothetical protein